MQKMTRTTGVKSDNHNLKAKLDLRRHLLHRYHANGNAQQPVDPIRVMDCCPGSGEIWSRLRREFTVESYFPIDQKAKVGRLKMDSVRVLAQPGWRETVIDIDTYGSPFRHWLAMLPNLVRPVTVFMTIGRGGPQMVHLGREELVMLGITMPTIFRMSGAITHTLADLCVSHALAKSLEYGWRIVEAVETETNGNARYIGIRVEAVK